MKYVFYFIICFYSLNHISFCSENDFEQRVKALSELLRKKREKREKTCAELLQLREKIDAFTISIIPPTSSSSSSSGESNSFQTVPEETSDSFEFDSDEKSKADIHAQLLKIPAHGSPSSLHTPDDQAANILAMSLHNVLEDSPIRTKRPNAKERRRMHRQSLQAAAKKKKEDESFEQRMEDAHNIVMKKMEDEHNNVLKKRVIQKWKEFVKNCQQDRALKFQALVNCVRSVYQLFLDIKLYELEIDSKLGPGYSDVLRQLYDEKRCLPQLPQEAPWLAVWPQFIRSQSNAFDAAQILAKSFASNAQLKGNTQAIKQINFLAKLLKKSNTFEQHGPTVNDMITKLRQEQKSNLEDKMFNQLLTAVRADDIEETNRLLEKMPLLIHKRKSIYSPLCCAVINNSSNMIKFLLSRDAKINAYEITSIRSSDINRLIRQGQIDARNKEIGAEQAREKHKEDR